jgi:hypothetical protein
MIIIVSNRKVNAGAINETLFGEEPNQKGLDELRLATAAYDDTQDRWHLELLPEPPASQDYPPSQQLFEQVIRDIDAGKLTDDWVFFVHGFNQSFPENLHQCHQLQQKYGVNIIAFSWPSNRGGVVTQEYRDARQAAQGSGNALDRTLEKLGRYMQIRAAQLLRDSDITAGCNISLNLLAHSLGNYVIEAFIRQPIFNGETQVFDNVILHQADVDNRRHAEWLDQVNSKRIYVTLNERDKVLKASSWINSSRLGNTVDNLNGKRPLYMDFTGAKNVGDSHNLFLGVEGNPVLEEFCRQVLTGGRGEMIPQFQFIARNNTYRIIEVS